MIWNLICIGFFIVLCVWLFKLFIGIVVVGIGLMLTLTGWVWDRLT